MHSGVVFWGVKAELRQMMTTLEQADVQVQMFHREVGGWALHVNFAGAEISRLRLECDRLRTDLARALPVVEAAEALAEHWDNGWSGGADYYSRHAALLNALARAVKGERG